MPVLAATATGKIVEGIVPPIKVGLLVPAYRRGTFHRGAVSSSGYGCERTSVLDSHAMALYSLRSQHFHRLCLPCAYSPA